MKFVTDAEWQAAAYPPIVTTRKLTAAETEEATALSVAISAATRTAERMVLAFHSRPISVGDLAALAIDSAATWAAWLDPLRAAIAGVALARKQHARLVALLGADATVLDHGWGFGREQMGVTAIGDAVAVAEMQIAPLVALDKATKAPARRAAA